MFRIHTFAAKTIYNKSIGPIDHILFGFSNGYLLFLACFMLFFRAVDEKFFRFQIFDAKGNAFSKKTKL